MSDFHRLEFVGRGSETISSRWKVKLISLAGSMFRWPFTFSSRGLDIAWNFVIPEHESLQKSLPPLKIYNIWTTFRHIVIIIVLHLWAWISSRHQIVTQTRVLTLTKCPALFETPIWHWLHKKLSMTKTINDVQNRRVLVLLSCYHGLTSLPAPYNLIRGTSAALSQTGIYIRLHLNKEWNWYFLRSNPDRFMSNLYMSWLL